MSPSTKHQALSTPSRILSGVQPTGNLHLGNYLGAIRNWVTLQHQYECFFFLADMHAITVPQDPVKLKSNVRETAAAYIACGIDPEKHAIFPQSAVHQHAELGWVLSCHTPLGWLNRMTQFKEKINAGKKDARALRDDVVKFLNLNIQDLQSGGDGVADKYIKFFTKMFDNVAKDEDQKVANANLGLYSYPVLMAADILLYRATHVPVGEDQKQHIELTRDIAGAFNRHYEKETFPIPEPVIMGGATRVMSLRDGTKKMSKSDPSDYSRIHLTDDADAIAQKIRKCKTDMEPGVTYDIEKRPESSNLLTLYSALSGKSLEAVKVECEADTFSIFKKKLEEVAVAHLAPISTRMRELMADPAELDRILTKGIERARNVAGKTMQDVKDTIGFW